MPFMLGERQTRLDLLIAFNRILQIYRYHFSFYDQRPFVLALRILLTAGSVRWSGPFG